MLSILTEFLKNSSKEYIYIYFKKVGDQKVFHTHTFVSVYETSVERSGPWPGDAMTVITLPPSFDESFIFFFLCQSTKKNRYGSKLNIRLVVTKNWRRRPQNLT